MIAKTKEVEKVPIKVGRKVVDTVTFDPNGPTTSVTSGWANNNAEQEEKPITDDKPEVTDLS